jgi:exopolyphosphatase / guanosine-5'-triphosphate,3'-diphosphate pyrophosphatase
VRLGVLDVGSNTVHLLVVDAHRGGHPTPMTSDTRMSSPDLAELEGVSPSRAPQLAAGALVAEAAMRALRVTQLEICPWALREGVILRRLDTLDGTAQIDRSAQDTPGALGRLTTYEARCTG